MPMCIMTMSMPATVRMSVPTAVRMSMMIPTIKVAGISEVVVRVANFNTHWFFFVRMGMVVSSTAAVAMAVMECKNT